METIKQLTEHEQHPELALKVDQIFDNALDVLIAQINDHSKGIEGGTSPIIKAALLAEKMASLIKGFETGHSIPLEGHFAADSINRVRSGNALADE